jgi:hypothetical protein
VDAERRNKERGVGAQRELEEASRRGSCSANAWNGGEEIGELQAAMWVV